MKIERATAWLGAVTLLLLTTLPVPDIDAPQQTDKGVHVVMFALLTCAYWCAYPRMRTLPLLAALVCYGAALEAVQYFLPYRSASALDIAANVAGTLIAIGACTWVQSNNKSQ